MFPLKSTTPHPACPRRPARNQDHTHQPSRPEHQPPRVFFERPLKREGSTQRIDVTSDRLRVRQFRLGAVKTCFLFEREDIETLERALDLTKSEGPKIRNAGRAPMRSGGYIEIGAMAERICLRIIKASGECDGYTFIGRDELVGFAMAVAHFKAATVAAARAAFAARDQATAAASGE